MIRRMSEAVDRLIALVARLRSECPWDREQTPETLRIYLLEETYEVLSAIDELSADGQHEQSADGLHEESANGLHKEPADGLRDELGDLLFQILFLARLAEERGWFSIDDVSERITRKMVDRHPHVFGGSPAARSADEVKDAWERRKRRQSGAPPEDPLGTLPAALPALAAAYRQTHRAGDLGFDWERDSDVVEKIEEELAEWRSAVDAGDSEAEAREIGDLLLSVVNLARRRKIDPESALRQANLRFRRRFAEVARRAKESGRDVVDVDMAELDRYWEEAKKKEF